MAYNPTQWQDLPSTNTPITSTRLNNMETGIKKASDNLSQDEYSTTKTYRVGELCIYNNNLYRCISAVTTAGNFDSSKWQQTNLTKYLNDNLHDYVIISEQDDGTALSLGAYSEQYIATRNPQTAISGYKFLKCIGGRGVGDLALLLANDGWAYNASNISRTYSSVVWINVYIKNI